MGKQRKVHALSELRANDGQQMSRCGEGRGKKDSRPILTSMHALVTCKRCRVVLGTDAL